MRARSQPRSRPNLLLRFIRGYVWVYRVRLLVAAGGLVLFSLTAFAQVRMLEPVLDRGFSAENSSTLYWLMGLMFSFSALRALAYYLQPSDQDDTSEGEPDQQLDDGQGFRLRVACALVPKEQLFELSLSKAQTRLLGIVGFDLA